MPDDGNRIKPIANFEQDKFIIEEGDEVSFINLSKDAVSFQWDFGDGSTSELTNPKHIYTEIGEYPVRLIVTSSTGDRVATSATIKVGRRLAAIFLIWNIEFNRDNGDPWDSDGSGPDLIFSYGPNAENNATVINMGQNFRQEDLPFGDILNPLQQRLLTNEEWTVKLRENDPSFLDLNQSEEMVKFTINPVTMDSNIDNIEGQGSIVMRKGNYHIEILFLIE